MFWQFFIWLILAVSAVELFYLLYIAWASSRVPRFALDDVIHFLYPVDTGLLTSLLDPAADFQLRWSLSPLRLREEQRRRMLVYRELLRRMAHNSAMLAKFDNRSIWRRKFCGWTRFQASGSGPQCARLLHIRPHQVADVAMDTAIRVALHSRSPACAIARGRQSGRRQGLWRTTAGCPGGVCQTSASRTRDSQPQFVVLLRVFSPFSRIVEAEAAPQANPASKSW